MSAKKRIVYFLLILSVLLSGCGSSRSYSSVVASYPAGAKLCNINVIVDTDYERLTKTTYFSGNRYVGTFPTFTKLMLVYEGDLQHGSYAYVTGELTVEQGDSIMDGGLFDKAIHCYGTKITLNSNVTLDGKSYRSGTLLTVDKDKNLVVVSSWK